MPDFAGSSTTLMDAYGDLRFTPCFGVLVGKTKSRFGLERLVSQTSLLFVERGLPTHVAPNRDIGIQVHGSLLDERMDYSVAVLNGTPDNGSSVTDLDDDKEFAGRLFTHPFRKSSSAWTNGLDLGVAGMFGHKSGTVPANYITVNQQTFFSYNAGAVNNGTKARSADVGLDCYLNRNVKAVVNYHWTGFDGPVTSPASIASKDEHAVFTRVQLNS